MKTIENKRVWKWQLKKVQKALEAMNDLYQHVDIPCDNEHEMQVIRALELEQVQLKKLLGITK